MTISYTSIGKNIRNARKALHLSQAETAERIGITTLHFGRIERGERRSSLDLLAKIAEALNTTLPSLLNGVQPTQPCFITPDKEQLTYGEYLAHLTATPRHK